MDLYTLSFIIAFVVGLIPMFFLCKDVRRRFWGFVLYVVVFYVLFYNFEENIIGGFFPIFHIYAGAAYSCILLLFLLSFEKSCGAAVQGNKWGKVIFYSFAQFLCILFIQSVPWAIDTFPLSNIEAILFTVFAGANGGAENFVLTSFLDKVFFPSIGAFLILFGILFLITAVLFKIKCGIKFNLFKINYVINEGGLTYVFSRVQKCFLAFSSIYCAILLFVVPNIVMCAPFRALVQIPVDSELYRKDYVYPDSVQIKNVGLTKNLIVILLESMETNFAVHTPEVNVLTANAINFRPGGESVAGTSWTIAAITGKLCGIPLNMPMGIEEYLGKLPTYLPNAKCLMNVLADRNYNQLCMQGSDGGFTQINDFFRAHGNVAVHDYEYYKAIKKIPENYKVFWGFEDRKLYHFAKEEIDSIANLGKPFAVYLSTIDTHQPNGYIDDSCAVELEGVEGKLPKALRCASKMLYSFILWAREQSWYENTVISVMGDHTMLSLSKKAGVPLTDSLYWVNFMFNSAIEKPVTKRSYSSLDMFPTLLESMGFTIDGHRMGLGRSLFSDSLTLLEKYGRHTLDSLLRVRSVQYDYFLMGEKK